MASPKPNAMLQMREKPLQATVCSLKQAAIQHHRQIDFELVKPVYKLFKPLAHALTHVTAVFE